MLSRLHDAFGHLPINIVLLGWEIPPRLEEEIAKETSSNGARLFRWPPWLTRATLNERSLDWAVIGPDSSPIPGYKEDPAFNFICPNRIGVSDSLAEKLAEVAARGLFQGVFLDRVRFPSPADDPVTHLGCFCKDCARLAAQEGLDLDQVQTYLQRATFSKHHIIEIIQNLLIKPYFPESLLDSFLEFRSQNIFDIVEATFRQAHSFGLSIGLDCFSPSLTRMVGQDFSLLESVSDWIKLMIYPRTFSPAGLSFEIFGLLNWLIRNGCTEPEAINIVSEATGFTFPASISYLKTTGFDSDVISHEVVSGRRMGIENFYAGLALSNSRSITKGSLPKNKCDILATRSADGLVVSWDLWNTPFKYLDAIRTIWEL